MKKLFSLLTLIVLAGTASAQEANEWAVATDSVVMDTIVADSDPEWYVAPIPFDSVMTPRRAPRRATADCPIDSVRIFDVDSVLTEVAIYEYGDTTRTITWTVNADGSRVGKSKTESMTSTDVVFNASYDWDNTTNNWKGTTKTEYVYANGNMVSNTTLDWVNNDWMPNTRYTYAYSAANKEIEYLTYTRNASNQLVLSKGRFREYNAAGKITLEINYTAHNGTDWSAGTKRIYDYDGNNTILNEYYSSYSNGAWVGSSREIWTYTAGKKTYYEKQTWSTGWVNSSKEIWEYNGPSAKQTYYEKDTWSNGAWVGSIKESWEFNDPSNKQTLHEKYGWANGVWMITLQENSGYDAAGNNVLVENYTYSNGVQKGSKKEEYTFSGTTKITTITYKWSNGEWVKNVWTVNDKVSIPNESCRYVWTNDAWVGNGTRTLTTNNSSKKPIEVITQTWPSDATNWVNSTRKTTEYEGAKTTQEASYKWSTEINDWIGTARKDWHYNAQGLEDTTMTKRPIGTEWVDSLRTVKTYNAANVNIMTHNAKWNSTESKWVMTSMTRTDISDVTIDGIRRTLNASWRCDADSIWIGVQKDTATYSVSNKKLYEARYVSWANYDWVPSYKIEYEYDNSERIISDQRFKWDANVWKGDYRHEYGYDEQGHQNMKASYVSWNTTTNSWIGNTKTEDTYGSNGQVSTSILSIWGVDTWKPLFRTMYTYDNNSTPREIKRTIEQFSNEEWVYTEQYIKEYNGSTQVKDNSFVWLNGQWEFSLRNEFYYDDDAQAKLRREVIGSWNNGSLLSFSDNYYCYACDPKACIVTFQNYDGTSLQSGEVAYGSVPTYTGAEPTKQGDAQYTYTFAGWDAELVAVTGAATYTATFNSIVNEYTVTFKNGEEVLQTGEVAYGTIPTYTGAEPTKEGDAQYTYTFAGWDAELVAVTGEATYTATFNSIVNEYTVTFKNGEEILQTGEVAYGTVPTYTGSEPTKQGDAQYTYTFAGWDAELVVVTGAATYTATFNSIVNEYTVTFKNGEEVLQTGEVAYGTVPTYTGAEPTKQGDAQYTYTFAGWDAELVAVTGEATYTATFNGIVNAYTITFKNGEEILQTGEVAYGTVPTYTGAEPTKQGDAEYSYTFAGWDTEPVAVTGEATYTATFIITKHKYTITWLYDDGTLLEQTDEEYGATPAYSGGTPTKPATAQYTFVFKGWNADIVPVTGAATYIAVFDSIVNQYTVIFYFEDGVTELERVEVPYGETPSPTYVPSIPGDAHYTYVFAGWSPEIAPVTGDASYTAVFTKIPRQYTVIFKNYNGTELQRSQVEYGVTPEYNGETPARAATTQYAYVFAGWSPEIAPVEGDATYTAVFDRELRQYTIVFLNYDGTELQRSELDYGAIPEYTGAMPTRADDEEYTYIFAGWTPSLKQVSGDASYTAKYTSMPKSHEGLDDVDAAAQATKVLINGQIFILRAGHIYTLSGSLVE